MRIPRSSDPGAERPLEPTLSACCEGGETVVQHKPGLRAQSVIAGAAHRGSTWRAGRILENRSAAAYALRFGVTRRRECVACGHALLTGARSTVQPTANRQSVERRAITRRLREANCGNARRSIEAIVDGVQRLPYEQSLNPAESSGLLDSHRCEPRRPSMSRRRGSRWLRRRRSLRRRQSRGR